MKPRLNGSGRLISNDNFVSRKDSEKKQSSIINAVGVGLFGLIYVGTALLTSTLVVLAEQALKLIPNIDSISTAIKVAETHPVEGAVVAGAALVGVGIARLATKSITD